MKLFNHTFMGESITNRAPRLSLIHDAVRLHWKQWPNDNRSLP